MPLSYNALALPFRYQYTNSDSKDKAIRVFIGNTFMSIPTLVVPIHFSELLSNLNCFLWLLSAIFSWSFHLLTSMT